MNTLSKFSNPKVLLPLLGVFLILAAGGVYYYYQVYLPSGGQTPIGDTTTTPPPVPPPDNITPEDPTATWTTYENTTYGFRFKYPAAAGWKVIEKGDPGSEKFSPEQALFLDAPVYAGGTFDVADRITGFGVVGSKVSEEQIQLGTLTGRKRIWIGRKGVDYGPGLGTADAEQAVVFIDAQRGNEIFSIYFNPFASDYQDLQRMLDEIDLIIGTLEFTR